MRQVYLVASKSKDLRTRIGAVLVKDNRIISQGYNGICMSVNDNVQERNERPMKYLYYAHAEANSVFSCARFGVSSLGSTIYTQGVPCANCTQAVIQAGVSRVIVHKQWPNLIHSKQWIESIGASCQMLEEAGIPIIRFDKELGLQGFLDGSVINV